MFDATLDEFASVGDSLVSARNSLEESLDKAYDLYHALLQLTIDLTNYRERQIEEAKNKYLPTADDLNPDMRLVENRFVAQLQRDQTLSTYISERGLSWENDDVMLRHLLDNILQSDIYKKYVESPTNSYVEDCEFWYDIMRSIIIDSDDLAEALEAKSVYWNDDTTIMGSFAMKTIRRYAAAEEGTTVELLPKFKDEVDAKFGRQLFDVVVNHQDQYREIINNRLNGSSWDPERLAFMDIIILETAIAELFAFDSIPTVVTVNEYTEIAHFYSTPNSGQFITGMLYAIIADLRQQGILTKE
jgi:N utilization substance protein B